MRRLLPNILFSKADPHAEYVKALNVLGENYKHQEQAHNEQAIFEILALRWGNSLADLLRRGLNFHKDDSARSNAAHFAKPIEERTIIEAEVLKGVKEALRTDHPKFAIQSERTMFEAKLLHNIVREASRGKKVPAVAQYIFHQLHAAWDTLHKLSLREPVVEEKGGAFVVVEDEPLDEFIAFLKSGHFDDFLAEEIAEFRQNRHEVEIDQARMLAEYARGGAGKLNDSQRGEVRQLR